MQGFQPDQRYRPDQRAAVEALSDYLQARQPSAQLTLTMVDAVLQLLANDQDATMTMTLFDTTNIVRRPASWTTRKSA